MTFKKILAALDGSTNSEKVLGSVVGIAGKMGSEVLLLAVAGIAANSGEQPAGSDAAAHTREAEDYLKSQASQLERQGIKTSTVVDSGLAAQTIISVAEREGVDVIAMATHRENVIERGILGSITDTVLRSATVPVLAINPDRSVTGQPWVPSTVIVPLDGSQLATESVDTAIDIAKSCAAEIIFVQAVHLPTFAVSGPGAELYGSEYGMSAEREKARGYLAQFVEKAKAAGVSARSHAALGNAAARIIEDSRNEPNAMIVISSHGRGGFRRMVLGSVADKIVRSSHHPVLVLKHDDD